MANNFNNSTVGVGDAVAARARSELKIFVDWLSANSVKGLVGEFGWPGSSNPGTDPIPGSGTGAKFDPAWDAVAQQWFIDANAASLFTTNWVASEWNVDLRSYRTHDANNRIFDYRTTVSSVLEPQYGAVSGVIRGVNLAGAEFSDAGPNGALNLSTTAQPGAGYYYPTVGDWAMLYSRGVRLVRFPFRWERLQRSLKQPLNGDITAYVNSITAAGSAGIKVLVDMHNYGRYDTAASGNTTYSTSGVLDIGQNAPSGVGGTMVAAFTDFWSRMATALVGNSGLWGYGLTNEPHDLTGGVSTWVTATQNAVEAIRLVDQTGFVSVGGYFYSTIPGWVTQNGSSAWLTETIPTGQLKAGQTRNHDDYIVFEGHHYWDNDHSGGYASTYATEVTNATNLGYTSYSNSNLGGVVATNNTSQTGLRVAFSTTFDTTGDFSGTYDSVITGSNTVTLPSSAYGNPGNSMKITCTATSDSAGVKKSLTGSVYRIFQFDVFIPVGSTVTTNNFTVAHLWQDNNSTDLTEVAIQGSGAGYIVGLRNPGSTTPYALINTTATILTLGTWNTITLTITDTAVTLKLNGSGTTEASYSASLTGVSSGGFQLGKYYGAYVGDIYFDNLSAGTNATYYAPPSGGYLAPLVGLVVGALLGLMAEF